MIPAPILWSDEAIQSLDDCVKFLRKTWNEKVIDDFLRLVDEKVDQIGINTKIGEKVFHSEFRKALVHRNVSIFYKEDSLGITILLIWDNRQNPESLYQKLISS